MALPHIDDLLEKAYHFKSVTVRIVDNSNLTKGEKEEAFNEAKDKFKLEISAMGLADLFDWSEKARV